MASTTIMDGSTLKEFVEDDTTWSKFVNEKFSALDKSQTGTLSHEEMKPAIAGVGNALGWPPMGESAETDRIYDEMLNEFKEGKRDDVSKHKFSTVMRDILLGLGDGLERDPVEICTLDGLTLQQFAQSAEFEVEAVSAFTKLDSQNAGTLKAITIKDAMQGLSVGQGMPPSSDPSVSGKIDRTFKLAGLNGEQALGQAEYVDLYRKVVLALAKSMREEPMTVAHSEKNFDGKTISELLKDKPTLEATLDQSWSMMPNTDNSISKAYLRLGLDALAPAAGLPPVGAIEEMDNVVNEAFKIVGANQGGSVNREEYEKCMLEVLSSIMLQLEGKPIGIKSSAVVADGTQLGPTMPF